MLETSARLLTLLSLLQARRDWPGETLAERLGVSGRTVRRDVDRLRTLGYPVLARKGPDGGYRLDAGSDLPPLLFDDEQAVAVALALQTATTGVDGLEEAALRALATVRQVMPARLRAQVDALQVTAVPHEDRDPADRVDSGVLLAVAGAVRAQEVLRFGYAAPTSGGADDPSDLGPPPRRAEPHHLLTWGGRWYCLAWDLDRRDWRTFRVDRMTPRTPTGPRFAPRGLPAPDVATYVRQQFRGVQDGSVPEWPCQGEALLAAPASYVARWAGRRAVVEALGPDRSRLVAGSWSWRGLAAWLGLFDADLEIVGPPELREAAAALAERYAAAAGVRAPVAGRPTP